MTLATLLIAAGLILISIVASVIARSQSKTAVTRFSRRFGLEVPPGMDETIRAGVQARRIGAPIGTVVGVTIATAIVLIFPGLPLLATWWGLFGSYLLGAGVGATIAIFIAEGKRESGVVRVARGSAVAPSDYVPPFQSVFAWCCVILATIAFAADCWLAAADSPGYLSIVSGVLVGLSAAALIAYWVVAHRVVRRGALAGTPLELAWDDALRSYALVNFNALVALIALYSLVAYNALPVVATARMAREPVFGIYAALLPIAGSIAIIALVALTTGISVRQHFLRRLWPDLAQKVATARKAPETNIPTEIMGTR